MSIVETIFEELGLPKPVAPARAGAKEPAGPLSLVNVVDELDLRAQEKPVRLDWKSSVIDLLILLDIDHSEASLEQLAVELGYKPSKVLDTAGRDEWMHKRLMQMIAENGGILPEYLVE